jgi:DMSO/TMAO reductase YedYZ molybdopterin-dependent catalytic subunit
MLSGFLAGCVALTILLGVMLISGQPGFLEAVSDGFTRYIPLDLFEKGIQAFGPLAKGFLFAGVCVGVAVAGALVGLRASRIRLRAGPLADALTVAVAALVIAEVVVLPIFQAGFFGSSLLGDRIAFHLPLMVASLAYGLVLIGLREAWAPAPLAADSATGASDGVTSLPRRTFLGRALLAVGWLSLAGTAVAVLAEFGRVGRPLNGGAPGGGAAASPGSSPLPGSSPAPGTSAAPGSSADSGGVGDRFGPTPALTPVDSFYVVQKNFFSPTVDGSTWRLRVDGLVNNPTDWTLDTLRALPAQTDYRTLECISNDVPSGGSLIGNQHWTGVRLTDLLDKAGVQPAASFILWQAADGYTESLPLDVARGTDVWIAYEMNGAPLTTDHGFPARVLIPGRFGMKQPKWLTRIQLADHDEQGYWEQRGWDEQAFVRNMSRIDSPSYGSTVQAGNPLAVTGVAYSGNRGIARVELSPDDGATWMDAALDDATKAPLGPLTWVRWRADVTLPAAAAGSTVRFVVRATSADGQVQDGNVTAPLPSGSTGWHAVRVAVVA